MRALLLLTLAGCGSQYGVSAVPEGGGWNPHTADEATLRTVAAEPSVATFHHDVALLCPDFGPERDFGSGCEIATLQDGALVRTGRDGLLSAWRFDDEQILTVDGDLVLALETLDGKRQEIATHAVDPRVGDDGRRAVFVQLEGDPQLGAVGHLTLYDAVSGQLRTISDDPADSAPWLVPSSDDVLFTSGRTGLASLWLAPGDGGPPRQITNVGLTEVGPDFVPVPSRELVWLPNSRKAVFSAHYGTHTLWLLDLDSGEARELGPGRLPALHPEGGVVAVDTDDPSVGTRIVRFAEGEL